MVEIKHFYLTREDNNIDIMASKDVLYFRLIDQVPLPGDIIHYNNFTVFIRNVQPVIDHSKHNWQVEVFGNKDELKKLHTDLTYMTEVACNRCHKKVDKEKAEFCWYCHAYLCIECWREVGHCGHLAADQANEEASRRQRELEKKKVEQKTQNA